MKYFIYKITLINMPDYFISGIPKMFKIEEENINLNLLRIIKFYYIILFVKMEDGKIQRWKF